MSPHNPSELIFLNLASKGVSFMDNWQKDFWEMVQTVSDEVERFFLGMSDMVDTFFEVTEEVTEQLHNTIVVEIDQYFQELTEPFLEMYWELEDIVGDDLDPAFPYPVEPSAEKIPLALVVATITVKLMVVIC